MLHHFRKAGRRWAVAIILVVSAAPCLAQPNSCQVSWDSPARLSFDSVLSVSPALAVSGPSVHAIWYGLDTLGGVGHSGIQYSRSTDSGASFSPPVTLVPAEEAFNPGIICCSGTIVVVSYAGVAEGSFGTAVVRSTDGGASWEPPRLLRASSFPRLITSYGNDFCIQYREQRATTSGILGSSDAGQTWEVRNTNAPPLTDMSMTATQIHAVGEYDLGLHHESGYYYSYDRGRSWGGAYPVSREDAAASIQPQLAVNEDETIFIVWNDTGSVALRRSVGFNEDDEIVWGPEELISGEHGAIFADIAAAGPFVSVVWDNDFGGRGGIRLRPSNDGSETFCAIDSPSVSSDANEPAITIDGDRVHLAWMESIGGAGEIVYRRGSLARDLRPKTFALKQNFPNPFNGSTIIPYDLPFPSFVSLQVYNILGQRIATLVNDFQVAAKHQVPFYANNLPSGIYFYRLLTPALRETRKLVIVR